MYHYVALVWNVSNKQASETALRFSHRLQSALKWSCIFSAAGLAVFHLPPRGRSLLAYRLPNEAGVILGRLFPTNSEDWHSNWQCSIEEDECRELVDSGGKSMLHRYWGRYVAFLLDQSRNRQFVIRDCSGMVPCYRTRSDGVDLLFSDIADLAPLELPAFCLNPDYLASFIHSTQLQIRDCGLKNVTEILAGESLEIRDGRALQFSIWEPGNICRDRSIESFNTAASQFRKTTQYCVDAWASTYDTILHSLSGGFDSAVVLGCLRNSPVRPSFACLNRYSLNAGEDERIFARLAATKANVELLEHPWFATQRSFDSELLTMPKTPKPTIPAMMGALDIAFRDQIANIRGAEAVWTGQGGDHLFWNVSSILSAADYVADRGIGLGLISAVTDASRYSREPYWSVLREAWRLGRSKSPWKATSVIDRGAHFVNKEALPDRIDEYVSHPWTSAVSDLPKGKQLQIYLLAEVLHRHRPRTHSTHVREHHPLLSQPLIELSLRVPLYLLLRGGRQRALAREAFREHLPAEILGREQKGSTASSLTDRIRRSESFIRELILDGVLVREKIINRESLEPFIVHGQAMRIEHLFPFLACIAAEIWIRNWTTTKLRIA